MHNSVIIFLFLFLFCLSPQLWAQTEEFCANASQQNSTPLHIESPVGLLLSDSGKSQANNLLSDVDLVLRNKFLDLEKVISEYETCFRENAKQNFCTQDMMLYLVESLPEQIVRIRKNVALGFKSPLLNYNQSAHKPNKDQINFELAVPDLFSKKVAFKPLSQNEQQEYQNVFHEKQKKIINKYLDVKKMRVIQMRSEAKLYPAYDLNGLADALERNISYINSLNSLREQIDFLSTSGDDDFVSFYAVEMAQFRLIQRISAFKILLANPLVGFLKEEINTKEDILLALGQMKNTVALAVASWAKTRKNIRLNYVGDLMEPMQNYWSAFYDVIMQNDKYCGLYDKVMIYIKRTQKEQKIYAAVSLVSFFILPMWIVAPAIIAMTMDDFFSSQAAWEQSQLFHYTQVRPDLESELTDLQMAQERYANSIDNAITMGLTLPLMFMPIK